MKTRELNGLTSNETSELDIKQSLRESELEVEITKRKEIKKHLKELVQRLEIVELKIESKIIPHEFDLLDIKSKLDYIQEYGLFTTVYSF
jgi:hypothetical protein